MNWNNVAMDWMGNQAEGQEKQNLNKAIAPRNQDTMQNISAKWKDNKSRWK